MSRKGAIYFGESSLQWLTRRKLRTRRRNPADFAFAFRIPHSPGNTDSNWNVLPATLPFLLLFLLNDLDEVYLHMLLILYFPGEFSPQAK
jgi:hypothetical protein